MPSACVTIGRAAVVSNMSKAERISYIGERLQSLYPETPVPLDHQDPYTLLIAVLLSAQCTDERVNQVTPALFKQANSPDQMVVLTVEAIRAIIRPCGLSPQKIESDSSSQSNATRPLSGRSACRYGSA